MTTTDWIPWTGGECPVAPDTMVDVRIRTGNESIRPVPAHVWDWVHSGGGGDIIAYRLEASSAPSPDKDELIRQLVEALAEARGRVDLAEDYYGRDTLRVLTGIDAALTAARAAGYGEDL